MLELFLIAAVGGLVLQLLTKNEALTAALGAVGYGAWSVYGEFFAPTAGGGASFWPIDMVFAAPCAAVGAWAGGCVTQWLLRKKDAADNNP